MRFEWDEDKRREILEKRGVDILFAALMFENQVLIKPDTRDDYGEERFIALGHVEEEYFTLIYTLRENAIRLITAWKAGKNGERDYKNRIAG